MKPAPRLIAIGVGIAVSAALFFYAVRSGRLVGRGPAPLAQSAFLRDVVEPITVVEGMSFSDGGSVGLRFKDALGVERDVCLGDTRVWEDDPTVLEGHHNIILNSFFPHGDRAQRVPVSGVEERALMGLLERWAAQDPDAQELKRRHRLLENGEIDYDAFWTGLQDRLRMTAAAVKILRDLRARN